MRKIRAEAALPINAPYTASSQSVSRTIYPLYMYSETTNRR